MRVHSMAFVVVIVAACGGKVDEQSPSPSSGSATNAPTNAPSGDGCARACDRIYVVCTDHADARDACARSCGADFDARSARAYAACIEGLDCATIERGLAMDFGPLGECWERARGR